MRRNLLIATALCRAILVRQALVDDDRGYNYMRSSKEKQNNF